VYDSENSVEESGFLVTSFIQKSAGCSTASERGTKYSYEASLIIVIVGCMKSL